MGNFRRGWSNSIATSDVLVRTPWLNAPVDGPAGAPQAGYSPYDILNDSLSLMTQAYRTGSGDGISSVTPWASCVQDSSQALFIALRQTEKLISTTRGADYCSKNEFKGLCNMVTALKSNFEAGEIFENAPMRGDWINNSLNLQIRRSSNAIENGYSALASYKTALPRHAFNLFLNTMLNQGLELLLMDNVQIGGYWTSAQRAQTFTPTPATTVFEVVKSAIEKAKGASLKTLTSEEFVSHLLKAEGVKSLEELNHRYPNF
jgi:predicted Abi (CAAX) family protease